MHRYILSLAYDGGDFSGWWRQPMRRTVAAELDRAFARIGEEQVECVGVARTDSGVHARGQLAQVTCKRPWETTQLAHKLNAQLPDDMAVLNALAAPSDYEVLRQIIGKTYIYRFDLSPVKNPFLARTSWRPPCEPTPDLEHLQQLSQAILGERDWRGLARRGDYRDDFHCHITQVYWEDFGNERRFTISGNRFTYRLVRSLVAVLWAVGRGNLSLNEFNACLNGAVNACAQHQAPARGLCLEQIAWDPPRSPA